jgi:luciferase family oxidoreductase group 1
VTAHALRRRADPLSVDEFPEQLRDLLGFFNGSFPEHHPYRAVTAVPGLGYQPALWLLGSSDYSAEVAGILGLPFSFAHHFAAANTLPALARYRASFRPSATLERPYALLAVSVLCAETDERARWLSAPSAVSFARRRTGRPGPLPTPAEAAEYHFTPFERELVRDWTATHVVGDPDTVRAGLLALAERTGADELMLTTQVFDHADRVHSYELVAEAMALAPDPSLR